mmetsp:Transcript_11646/g.33166  ORF Transcript_11646/g.33166 Transcript_11646/m.33166 type:complete len:617 (-) Transcript_11646:66-1916(-)
MWRPPPRDGGPSRTASGPARPQRKRGGRHVRRPRRGLPGPFGASARRCAAPYLCVGFAARLRHWGSELRVALEEPLLFDLPHLIPRQRLHQLQLLGDLVCRQAVLPPLAELGQGELAIDHADGGDLLAPHRVGLADDGALLDLLVLQEDGLDLQGRDLVAAGLDDVDGAPAHDPVDGGQFRRGLRRGQGPGAASRRLHSPSAVLQLLELLCGAADLAAVPRAEPAVVRELLPRRLLLLVVLLEQAGALDQDAPVLVALHVHVRQWPPDAARVPGAVDLVAQAHANLCHTVALEQHVAGDFGPRLHRRDGQRGRTGDHVAERVVAQALHDFALAGLVELLQVLRKLDVHGRHRVEAGDVAGAEAIQAEAGVERGELDAGAVEQRRVQDVLNPVDVVQGQDVQGVVARAPLPSLRQRGALRGEALEGVDDALRLAGGPGGEEDERVGVEGDLERRRGGLRRALLGHDCVRRHAAAVGHDHRRELTAELRRDGAQRLDGGLVRDEHRSLGVLHEVLQLRLWGVHGQGHAGGARGPDGELGDCVGDGGMDDVGHVPRQSRRRARQQAGHDLRVPLHVAQQVLVRACDFRTTGAALDDGAGDLRRGVLRQAGQHGHGLHRG